MTGMPLWAWIIVAFLSGGIVVGIVLPRLARYVKAAPPPDLPERYAPGWNVQCTRCGRTRALARVGGIRMGANRGATKATLGWCRGCRGFRIIRLVHESRMRPS